MSLTQISNKKKNINKESRNMSYHKLGMAYEDVLEKFQNLHEIHEQVIGMDMSGELPEQELLF